MKTRFQHVSGIVRRILFLLFLFVGTNLSFAFSAQVEISYDIETCDYALEVKD